MFTRLNPLPRTVPTFVISCLCTGCMNQISIDFQNNSGVIWLSTQKLNTRIIKTCKGFPFNTFQINKLQKLVSIQWTYSPVGCTYLITCKGFYR